jgi:hypothetical protein
MHCYPQLSPRCVNMYAPSHGLRSPPACCGRFGWCRACVDHDRDAVGGGLLDGHDAFEARDSHDSGHDDHYNASAYHDDHGKGCILLSLITMPVADNS